MQLLCSLPVMRACRRSASYMSAQSSQCQRFSSLRPSWRSRRDCAVVEKVAQRVDLDGEIDVLGNIAGRLDDSQRIELCTNHADNIAAAVMQRSSAIAGLNGCADLQKTRIVMQPRQGADDSGGHSEVGCEKTMQRITDCNHLVTRSHGASANGGDVLFLEFLCSFRSARSLVSSAETTRSFTGPDPRDCPECRRRSRRRRGYW